MNIAFKKTMPFALAAAIAVSGGSLALIPGTAMANTQGSTVLSLRAVDNPFNAGTDQRFTINEGEDLTLSGDITGGFGDVTYRWYVSSDGGEHWDLHRRSYGFHLHRNRRRCRVRARLQGELHRRHLPGHDQRGYRGCEEDPGFRCVLCRRRLAELL